MSRLVFASLSAMALGCGGSGARPPAEPARVLFVPRDSATVERLCAEPEKVRAGLAECVLKDQSERLTAPPPPRPLPPPGSE